MRHDRPKESLRLPYDTEGHFTLEPFCDACHQSGFARNRHTKKEEAILYFRDGMCRFWSGQELSIKELKENWEPVRCHN